MNAHAVVMAGGSGTRFWPLSRVSKPKQYLSFNDNKIIINETIQRLEKVFGINDIFIITTNEQKEILNKVINSELPQKNIVYEPFSKNTLPCISLMTVILKKKYSEEDIMCVFPSDHHIQDTEKFIDTLKIAINAADKTNHLITIGIVPKYPSTGYGYIHSEKKIDQQGIYYVKEFVEKPNIEKAKEYCNNNEYLWNSGIYAWKISSLMDEMQKLQPNIYNELLILERNIGSINEEKAIHKYYSTVDSISIDYKIMEKSRNVSVIPGDFGWNDIGSWEALETFYQRDLNDNIIVGQHTTLNTSNCILYGKDHTIATYGLDNIVIVQSEDITLVCHKNKLQDIKELIMKIDMKKR